MKLLAVLLVGETAAAVGTETPTWAYVLGVALPVVLGGRWYINRRLSNAQAAAETARAELTEHQSDLTEQHTEQIKEELRLSVLESVRTDMARQREETARAQAAEKEAIAEVAILIAQHQRDRAEWREIKHDYEGTIRDQANQITLLRGEVETLRSEVHTLRVALGVEQDRRVSDTRFSQIEARAREQELRNDDTPGHA